MLPKQKIPNLELPEPVAWNTRNTPKVYGNFGRYVCSEWEFMVISYNETKYSLIIFTMIRDGVPLERNQKIFKKMSTPDYIMIIRSKS